MNVTFEGVPPFSLPIVQSSTVQVSVETVEMTLFLLTTYQQMSSLHVPMSIDTARTLGLALSRLFERLSVRKVEASQHFCLRQGSDQIDADRSDLARLGIDANLECDG